MVADFDWKKTVNEVNHYWRIVLGSIFAYANIKVVYKSASLYTTINKIGKLPFFRTV
jgi:hypothetical protein